LVSQSSNLKSQNHNSKIKVELAGRCYHYSIKVISFIGTLPEKRLYWVLSDQLLRAATSIGANIVEAKSASSKKDFIKYYEIALKSANETKYWLGLFRDSTPTDPDEINLMLKEAQELSKILAASLLTMKNKNKI
jgi:four helix bundle protein